MRVLLIANYAPDRQQSMLRFAAVLERELGGRGHAVTVLAPRCVVGRLRASGGLGKWLGYVDKFVLFPFVLRAAIRRATRAGRDVVVHVCDHSNAVYTRYLGAVPHLVTCNDLLAVRSARGEFAENPTRWSGRVLQRMILRGLNRARRVACISDATRRDVVRLTAVRPDDVHRVYMGLNYPYRPVAGASPAARPYIIHVGGNQWYKNRLGALRIYSAIKRRLGADSPALVMVGAPFTAEMRAFVAASALSDDVHELNDVDNERLAALYSAAEVLIYPSLAEGFGWPVLEAMACGCRVATSNRAPMTEVGGDAVLAFDPADEHAAADAVVTMLRECPTARQARIERGLRQATRFSTAAMVDEYVALYASAIGTAVGECCRDVGH